MEELLPALFILIIWVGIIRSAVKAATKKQTGKAGPARSQQSPISRRKSGPKAKYNPWEAEPNTASAPAKSAEKSAQVFQTMMPLDEMSRTQETSSPYRDQMPSGSLRVEHGEGYDPCHDDPSGMPSGSLRAETTEGMDPCHDEMEHARPMVKSKAHENAEAAPGFRLGYSGNDIVQGFVWGEILSRKRA